MAMVDLTVLLHHGGFTSCRRDPLSRNTIAGGMSRTVARPPNYLLTGVDGRAKSMDTFANTLARRIYAHSRAPRHLRAGGAAVWLFCARGFSKLGKLCG